MELDYWSSTECRNARWDEAAQEWVVTVRRGPARPSCCARSSWSWPPACRACPRCRSSPAPSASSGEQVHSSEYRSGEAYGGKHCVVVGSNNSAHDICADLWENGAQVTMLQRSSTLVVRSETLMDAGLGQALLRGRAAPRHHHRARRHDARVDAVSRDDRGAEAGLRGDRPQGRRVLRAPAQGRLHARLRRGRLGALAEVHATRLGLLHRRRRLRARGQWQHRPAQRRQRSGGARALRGARRRQRAAGRPDRLRDRLRVDERLGREDHLAGGRRPGRQVLGTRLRHREGPRPVGGRAAQHVEAHAPARGSGSTAATCSSRASTRCCSRCSSRPGWKALRRRCGA